MADEFGERTEEATPKRRREAREAGQVAQSQDFSAALLLLAATVALWLGLRPVLGQWRVMLSELLTGDWTGQALRPDAAVQWLGTAGGMAARSIVPLLIVIWLGAALSHLVQIGLVFAPRALTPKPGKLNPLAGFKRLFGVGGLVKVTMDSTKVVIVLAVVVVTVTPMVRDLVALPQISATAAAAVVGGMLFQLALRVCLALLVLGILDLWWQKGRHHRQMRMTRQEVKEEFKQTEGDPDVKRRRLRMQQQIAMQRVAAAVPKADVVVTNPEHISIAIQYDAKKMNAPRVIAKGADYLALRIRQLARQHGIPIVERKPLARMLYQQVEVNQEVPPQFYQAVAEILAYVYRLSGKAA